MANCSGYDIDFDPDLLILSGFAHDQSAPPTLLANQSTALMD